MHYRVRGRLIATEFTAKPPSQASAHLLAFLNDYKRVAHACDYGCGKLRYAGALFALADSVTLVDSPEQLDRHQLIDGHHTTVRQLAKQRWPTARIETVSQFQARSKPRFDFVLCASVLSAIPTRNARTRALRAIARRLKAHGVILVVNQHTNSYYSQTARRDDVISHLDGYLVPSNGSASYYGILGKERTAEILTRQGYKIIEQWIEGQSNYALARIG